MPVPEFPPAPPGNPEQLRTAATGFRRLLAGLDPLAGYVRGIAGRLYEQAWRGQASVAFLEYSDHIQWIMRQAGDRATEYARVCDQWAVELQAAQQRHQTALAAFEQAREQYNRSFLTDPAQEQEWRDSGEEGMRAAVAYASAAVADAEVAEQQAAAAFAAITPPAFGALTERLFGPDGVLLSVADGADALSDAAGVAADVLEQRKRLWWVRMLGNPARLAQLSKTLPAGAVLEPFAAGLQQYAEDLNNPLLTPEERRARAAEDAVVRTTYSAISTAAWAKLGAEAGAIAGPGGAIVGGIVGGAYGGYRGDAEAEQKLDEARGEVIPPGESALPGPNEVVDPPRPPREVTYHPDPDDNRIYPPELADNAGFREEAPPPSPPSREWLAMQEALREGAPEPAPPPPSVLPRPG